MQVPADTKVSVLPLTVHTPEVLDVSETVRPEEEDALRAAGVTPMVWLTGCVKVMVWGAVATLKL